MEKVFVYGSLLSGMGNHAFLKDSYLVGGGVILEELEMIDLGSFPALVPATKTLETKGELYEVSEETFEALDRLEGFPSFYNRKKVVVSLLEEEVEGWVYYLPTASSTSREVVFGGCWRTHQRQKEYSPFFDVTPEIGEIEEEEMYAYFAYGSNMATSQMWRRCPDAEEGELATLRGWKLVFVGKSQTWGGKGVASVVYTGNQKDIVQGGLFYVHAEDLAFLDRCEGHPAVYQRTVEKVEVEDLSPISAYVYSRPAQTPQNKPSKEYLARIKEGYDECEYSFDAVLKSIA